MREKERERERERERDARSILSMFGPVKENRINEWTCIRLWNELHVPLRAIDIGLELSPCGSNPIHYRTPLKGSQIMQSIRCIYILDIFQI